MAIGGKGKGRGAKSNKPQRGGRKHFSRDMWRGSDVPAEDKPGMWEARTNNEDDDSNSDDSSSEEESGSDAEALNKKKPSNENEDEDEEDSDDDLPENPNVTTKASKAKVGKTAKKIDTSEPRTLSRREREEAEKAEARARYMKLHQAGKTEQARADLARLAIVRQQREQAARQKEAERLEKEEAARKKKEMSKVR
ncbi:hypothetical protein NQZ79_g4701 [Umbelopsis isabellina]|nr:hypothetical protein NQZ79_g4701 [Umbelopsis isabellina]